MQLVRGGGCNITVAAILVTLSVLATACASGATSSDSLTDVPVAPTQLPTAPPPSPVASPTSTSEPVEVTPTETVVEPTSIEERSAALGRGINLGNALEAPGEGEWGVVLEANYFDTIAAAGFDSVRIPVRWSAHAAEASPYDIEPEFFERVDWALDQAERVGLTTVLDLHHYDGLHLDPAGHTDRFLAIWSQIANRYADRPESVYFEPLNEPTDEFTQRPELWNDLFAEVLAVIRVSNPTRAIVVGPVEWNHPTSLDSLLLPPDPNLIVTIHFYEPFQFTHQGATWIDAQLPVGVSWTADSLAPATGWQYASWDTRANSEGPSVDVVFDAQWGALGFRADSPFDATLLAIEARGPATLDVICTSSESFDLVDRIELTDDWLLQTADISACGSGVTDIALQNTQVDAGPIALRSVEVCTASACEPLLDSAANQVSSLFAGAQTWAVANDRPMYVGEFGAYFEADLASRSRWTAAVQEAARGAGMSTSYWEFIAGYGAYDGDKAQWRQPLLDALMGDL